jgi:hypothetical protein
MCGLVCGCEETVPPSETARISRCERPDAIDTSLLEPFEVKFDGIDPRVNVASAVAGSRVHITGVLALKPSVRKVGDGMSLVIGFRPIIDGKADWSASPCDLPDRVEWSMGVKQSQQRGVLVSTIDRHRRIDMQAGEYELRF